MKNCCRCLFSTCLILVLILIYISTISIKSTMKSAIDGHDYKVIDYFENQDTAAEMLSYINENNQALIDYMNAKYITHELDSHRDPEWNSHYALLTKRLISRYLPRVLSENDPPDSANTSWTENKGEILTMCIREKQSGDNNFHDLNILTFVGVHELAHIASIEYGHDIEFWFNFKCLLDDAVEMGIYKPVDYSKNPINYCSLPINHSPLFDNSILTNPSQLNL